MPLVFKCPACRLFLTFPEDWRSFPLCFSCFQTLPPPPRLCSTCGNPACGQTCLSPWLQDPYIQSYSTRYLLFTPTYRCLRRWKACSGLLFDRRVLKSADSLIQEWQTFGAEALVPIPQNDRRVWKMKGSRTLKIALWIQKDTGLPILPLLSLNPSSSYPRQAEMDLQERLQSPNRFGFVPGAQVKRVILVDDFRTTGKTLRNAASVLRQGGVEAIHAFALGVKIPKEH